MKRLYDERTYIWPHLFEGGGIFELRFNTLTPIGYSISNYLLLVPLSKIWRGVVGLLFVDLFLMLIGIAFLPIERGTVYAAVAVSFLLWQWQMVSRNGLIKFIFGRRVKLRVVNNQLFVMGWFRKKIYDLDHDSAFGLRPFDRSQEPVYQNSLRLELHLSRTIRLPIIEVFGHQNAQLIVANGNMLLQLAMQGAEEGLDIDPTRITY